MKNLLYIFTILFLFSCENKNQENIPFEKINLSEKEILKEISDSTLHNVVGKDELIPDEKTAISVAEPILFKSYRKDTILKEIPYKIGKVQNYWVIYGTFNSTGFGGVFEIIMDSKNGRIVRLTHGE